MALSSVDNFLIDPADKNFSDNEFPFAAFESIFKRIELVMNSNSPTPLKRCPSNVSVVSNTSGISNFSTANRSPKSLYSDYHVGDYVYVDSISGVKYGIIRYAGYVEFAKGYWFGIELSEQTGKNNGSIKGKSYFTCPENHGIFTQSSKISKSPPIKKTHRLTSATGSTFGSRESFADLKRNGLNTSQESLRSCVSGVSAITGVFKQSSRNMKNQLLRAKQLNSESPSRTSGDKVDNLRDELSYLSVNESEQLVKSKIELTNQKRELEEQLKQNENEINELKTVVSEEKKLAKELVNQLEEEKKKMEMLEFRLEEEKITRMHVEEEMHKKEKQIDELKRNSEDAATLKNDENEIELFELQEESIKKEEKILQLESTLKSKQNENSNLLERTREYEQTIKVFEQSQKNYLTKVDDLNLKIKKYELEKSQLEDALANSTQEKGNLNTIASELSVKNKEIEELKDQLTKKSNEIVMLKDELNRMNRRIADVENEKSNLETTGNSLTKQIELLKAKEQTINERLSKSDLEHCEERNRMIAQIEQYKNQLADYKSKIEEFKKSEEHSNESLRTKESNINQIEKELAMSRSEIDRLKADLQKLTDLQERRDVDTQKLKVESERLLDKIEQNLAEKQQLENELDDLKLRLESKESELNKFNKNKLQYQNELETVMRELSNEKDRNREILMNNNEMSETQKDQLASVHKELDLIKKEKTSVKLQLENCQLQHQNELETVMRELSNEKDRNREILMKNSQMNETQKDQLTSAHKELDLIKKAHANSNLQLEEQISLAGSLQTKCSQMELKVKDLEKNNHELKLMIKKRELSNEYELNSLRDEHNKVMNEVERKLAGYEDNLRRLEDGLVEKDFEINSLQLEHQKKLEQVRLDLSSKCNELERQVAELTCQLERCQLELNEQRNRAQSSQVEDQLSNDEKDLYDSQISFLNSVIVDMQLQNDELKSKVKMLEEIRLEEMSMLKLNAGQDGDHNDQFSFRPTMKEQLTHQLYFKSSTQRTTRLFCSICDKFDLHDTEDCPAGLRVKQENAQHTRLNQPKKQTRAYCVNCEEFSHWTMDCPNVRH